MSSTMMLEPMLETVPSRPTSQEIEAHEMPMSQTGTSEAATETTAMPEPAPLHLTKREIEVLTLVFEGYSSRDVAERLYVSKRTVDFHLDNIYNKLKVTNRVAAFRRAVRLGLLPQETSLQSV